MKTFQIDTTIELTAFFTQVVDGQPVDHTEVALLLQGPNAAAPVQVTYPGTVTKVAVGQYSYSYTPTASGTWTYKWQGIGAIAAASPDKQFVVQESVLIPG